MRPLLGLETRVTARGWVSLLKPSAVVWQRCESSCTRHSEQCNNVTFLTLAKNAEQLAGLATSALYHVNRPDISGHPWHTWLCSAASFWLASPANITKRWRMYSSVVYPVQRLPAIPYTHFSAQKRKSGQFFTLFQISYKPQENL
jgi:hypothetical protein